jgi:hypothetical protein
MKVVTCKKGQTKVVIKVDQKTEAKGAKPLTEPKEMKVGGTQLQPRPT